MKFSLFVFSKNQKEFQNSSFGVFPTPSLWGLCWPLGKPQDNFLWRGMEVVIATMSLLTFKWCCMCTKRFCILSFGPHTNPAFILTMRALRLKGIFR